MSSTWRPQQKKISKRQIRRKRALFWGLFFVALFVIIFVVCFVFGFFRLRGLEIGTTRFLNRGEVLSDLNNYFDSREFLGVINFRKNIILINKEDFDFLLVKYPEIQGFEIDKNWRAKIISFSFVERESAGILCASTADNCFYFDKDLRLFSLASEVEGSLVMLINDDSGKIYNLGDNIFSDSNGYFLKIKELLDREFYLTEIKINNDGLVFVFNSGKEFKFDGNDLTKSYLGIKALMENDFDFSTAKEYVDLRYLPIVYYK